MDAKRTLASQISTLDSIIEWGVAVQVREGEDIPGDHYAVCPTPGHILVAAIDGIGHGPHAASASRAAVSTIEANADQPLSYLFTICHKELHNTRGVVMSLAAFDRAGGRMAWLGIGNVAGRLLRADRSSRHVEEDLLVRSGVVGHDLPATLAIGVLPVARGDVLIFATDGVHQEFTQGLHIGRSAHQIANDVLMKHSKGTDDAL